MTSQHIADDPGVSGRADSVEPLPIADRSLVRWRRSGETSYTGGLVHEGRVYPLAGIQGVQGDVLQAAIHAMENGCDELLALVTKSDEATVPVDVCDVDLGVPLTHPDKILCLGLNYVDHASEAGFEAPEFPIIFSKFRNCLVGARDEIVIPRVSSAIDFEGELAVVIGRSAKHVPRDQALDYVAAYSVFNDVTARDLQLRTSQWISGKALDTFAPMGPGLVPAELVPDPQALTITTTVSGEVMQHDSTSAMIFDVAGTISYLSGLMTLEPGDIIATGTPAGVGFKQDPPRLLTAGDVVEINIDGIGTIRNQVAADSSADGAHAGETTPGLHFPFAAASAATAGAR